MTIIEVLREFQGIIGAVLGGVSILIATKWLESKGKIEYFFENVKIVYLKQSPLGDEVVTDDVRNASSSMVSFTMEIYNSSNITKVLRNIRAQVTTERSYLDKVLSDDGSRKSFSSGPIYDALLYINVPPKEIIRYKVWFSIRPSDFEGDVLEEIKEVYLSANDVRGCEIKRLVYKE